VDETEAWSQIDAALRQIGFVRDWTVTHSPTYLGCLDPHGLAAEASVVVDDLDFRAPPTIRLKNPSAYGRMIAHVLGPAGDLCYLDGRARVLDRYDPGGTVLSCVEAAAHELKLAASGQSDGYFLDDFTAYWNADFVYADLGPKAKDGEIAWVALNGPSGPMSGVLTAKGALAPALLARHRQVTGKPDAEPERQPCPIVTVNRPLRVDPTQPWPPRDLEAVIAWLEAVAPDAVSALDRRFGELEGPKRLLGLRAENGLYILQVDVPDHMKTQEFLNTRRGRLWRNLLHAGRRARVERISTVRLDAEYLVARNLSAPPAADTPAGLMGRRIALIGCGSIGSFLADQLARSGAGMGGGRLALYDPDKLMPANLCRHLLSMAYLNRNKAEGLGEHLLAALPHLSVSAYPVDALSALDELADFDLVVDATGEEAFSIALNARALRNERFAPLLHVWLLGNGAAAETLLNDGRGRACYKCLKPSLAGAPRHRILRPEVETELRQNYACGDALFVPYPISRGMGAAGLALDLALDWAAGRPSPRHRVRTFEASRTFQTKDGDPDPSNECPACRTIL